MDSEEDLVDVDVGLDVDGFDTTDLCSGELYDDCKDSTETNRTDERGVSQERISRTSDMLLDTEYEPCAVDFQAEGCTVPDDVDMSLTSQDYLGGGLSLDVIKAEMEQAAITGKHLKTTSPRKLRNGGMVHEEQDADLGFNDLDGWSECDIDFASCSTVPGDRNWHNSDEAASGLQTTTVEHSPKSPSLKECWKDPVEHSLPKLPGIASVGKSQRSAAASRQGDARKAEKRSAYRLPPLNGRKKGH